MMNKKINILIVHYNTPKLTECLVKSINKFVGANCTIYIFDNSDKNPFRYKQDNIVLFDNTQGQIINFENWLEQFTKKGNVAAADGGRRISARHCISVDKCFDLINDNFILLDSDILLKKDISVLYDDKYLFCGQLEKNLKNIIRLTPYLCFINVNKCKELNLRYFDKNRMHGLIMGSGNWYDTGAAFYFHANKYPHNLIKLDDYIVHYKGASWDHNYVNNKKVHGELTPDEWIYKHSDLYKDNLKTKVIYTCITGGYENIVDPSYVQDDFDYICFTDNTNQNSKVWQFRPIPSELQNLSKIKQQRIIKICPHKYLPSHYKESIWVDGAIDILGDMNEFIQNYCNNPNKSVYIRKHPKRNCLYIEANICMRMKKDTPTNIYPQIKKYRAQKFPENSGLVESNIIYRKHNNSYCVRLMNAWADEIKNGSHRDQLSFNYCLWKIGNSGFQYLDTKLVNSKYFKWYSHHDRK